LARAGSDNSTGHPKGALGAPVSSKFDSRHNTGDIDTSRAVALSLPP
jgi:hypothetical protein